MRTEEAFVLAEGRPSFLARRTERALGRLRVAARRADEAALAAARGPVWILRAGAEPLEVPRALPSSATGRTLLAFGATRDRTGALGAGWAEVLAATGGDLGRARALPRPDSVLVEEPSRLAHRLASGLEAACAELAAHPATRAVRHPALDVTCDARLRVVEVVTTLHRGGAERVTLDLVRELRARGDEVTLAVLDRATRAVLETPDGTVDLTARAPSRAGRIDALAALVREVGADVVHVHLADGAEVRRLSSAVDVPVVLTLHNDRRGWAARTTELGPEDVALVVGCSAEVARAFVEDRPALASRTRIAWNGIAREAGPVAGDLRAELGVPSGALLAVVVANHRPQKRLERLPAVASALVAKGVDGHVAVVGEAVSHDPVATAIAAEVRAEASRLGVAERVHLAGTREDAASALAQADVVLSVSDYEGLSLVHLEAMRAGRPLVTTAVSGTSAIAAEHEGVTRVPVEATPEAIAEAVAEAAQPAAPRPRRLAVAFGADAMAARYGALLARATRPRDRRGLVLVANNFATGGAQSSARRLLLGLRAAGVPVAAAVLQEQAAYPTAGRRALEEAGVPVLVAPRAGAADPAVSAEAIADFVDARAPQAVVFWNAITQHKVLVAELLAGAPVWDVSPGEMYFASMDRYFERPRAGHPVRDARAYGAMLAGVVVKYHAERGRAEEALGAPVHVVPNGVPLGPPRAGRRADRVVVGTLARVNPDKKLGELVQAVRHAVTRAPGLASRLEVRIAGPVEQGCEAHAEELRALAEGLPVAFVGEQEASTFLAGLDLFAMISEPSGCPNASLEAMAAGLAVVATDVGGAREQILSGETGLVTPRGDVVAFGDALARLASDPDARERMGAAARARIAAAFSEARMVSDYARLFGLDLSRLPAPAAR